MTLGGMTKKDVLRRVDGAIPENMVLGDIKEEKDVFETRPDEAGFRVWRRSGWVTVTIRFYSEYFDDTGNNGA